MVNPITEWIKNGIEAVPDAEASFEDRVAETSINAQKIVDERHNTHQPYQFWREERRTRGFDHFFVAHSSLKATPGGYHSSFKTVNYYIDEAEAKRDELLKKYDKTTEYWNEKKFGVQESELIALKQLNDTEKAT